METVVHEYRWILFLLFIFGHFPSYPRQGGQLIYSFAHNVYSFALHFLLLFSISDLFLVRFIDDFRMFVFISILANAVIELLLTFEYFVSALFFWRNRFVHLEFFNDIVRFDRNTAASALPVALKKSTSWFMRKTYQVYLLMAIFVGCHIRTVLYINKRDEWYELILDFYLIVIMNVMCLMSLHIRVCSDLLNDRFDVIRDGFGWIERNNNINRPPRCDWLVQRFTDLWELRIKFQKLFSQILLTTMWNDQLQMAYCTFMQMLNIAGNRRMKSGLMFPILSFFLFPVVRKALVVQSVNRLGKQVLEPFNTKTKQTFHFSFQVF